MESTIDLVWSTEAWREWEGQGREWTTSDHRVIAGWPVEEQELGAVGREGRKLDWEKIEKWVKEEEKKEGEVVPLNAAYGRLRELVQSWQRTTKLTAKSKAWWDKEVREERSRLRAVVRDCKRLERQGVIGWAA